MFLLLPPLLLREGNLTWRKWVGFALIKASEKHGKQTELAVIRTKAVKSCWCQVSLKKFLKFSASDPAIWGDSKQTLQYSSLFWSNTYSFVLHLICSHSPYEACEEGLPSPGQDTLRQLLHPLRSPLRGKLTLYFLLLYIKIVGM